MTRELLVYVIDSLLSLVSRRLVLGEALPIGQDDAARANGVLSSLFLEEFLSSVFPPCFGFVFIIQD
jgi:hypothetical protein